MQKISAAVLILLTGFMFWGCERAQEVSVIAPETDNIYPPEILFFTLEYQYPQPYDWTSISCIARDLDNYGPLYYYWNADAGNLSSYYEEARWQVNYPGVFWLKCTVSDGKYSAIDSLQITVGAAPITPHNPAPANNELNVSVNINLYWECSDLEGDSIYYNVYLNTEYGYGYGGFENPVAYNLIMPNFDPGELEPNTVYYWGVEARDQYGHTSGMSYWTFTTAF